MKDSTKNIPLAELLGKNIPEEYNYKIIRCPICKSDESYQKIEQIKFGYRSYLYCPICAKKIFTITGIYKQDVVDKFKDHYKHVSQNGIAPAVKRRDF